MVAEFIIIHPSVWSKIIQLRGQVEETGEQVHKDERTKQDFEETQIRLVDVKLHDEMVNTLETVCVKHFCQP